MVSSRVLIVAAVGAGCIVAAGVGGYLAVKSGTTTPAAETLSSTVATNRAADTAESPTALAPVAAPASDASSSVVSPAEPAAESSITESSPAESMTSAAPPTAASTPHLDSSSSSGSSPAAKTADRRAAQSAPRASDRSASVAVAPSGPPPEPLSSPVAALEDAGTSVTDLAAPAPEPPKQELDELTIPSNSVIGFRLDEPISTATARVEDRVTAHVTRDVTVNGRTAIPAGSRLEGTVTVADPGGKFKDRARLGIRFMTVILADNTHVPIQTETIFRDGEAPGNEAASKIGAGAVLGTILGAVLGGKRGAAIGTTVGAAGGTAAVASGDVNDAIIAADVPLTVRLTNPVTVVVDRVR